MSYYRILAIFFVFTGLALVSYSEIFRPYSSSLIPQMQAQINGLNEKITRLEIMANSAMQAPGGKSSLEKIMHAEVLEVIRAERNVYEKIQENERYTRNFLVSVLGVIIAAIGLFSLFGIQYFIKKIADKAEGDLVKRIDIKTSYAQSVLFNHMGYFQYCEYDNKGDKAKEGSLLLNSAITSTRHAYMAVDWLPDDSFAENKNQIINNLAYYLALRNEAEDSREALRLAELSHCMSKLKIPHGWYDWEESYAFVLFTYGLKHQKQYAFKLVEKLVKDPDIEDELWKKETKEEWDARKKDWEKDKNNNEENKTKGN
jgi:hypothetical protein